MKLWMLTVTLANPVWMAAAGFSLRSVVGAAVFVVAYWMWSNRHLHRASQREAGMPLGISFISVFSAACMFLGVTVALVTVHTALYFLARAIF